MKEKTPPNVQPKCCRDAIVAMMTKVLCTFLAAILLALVMFTTKSTAQNVHNGLSSPGFEPGSPAGSYAVSDLENVNLFSRNLNFTLPLAKVGGRGGAQGSIMLPIESQWSNWYFFQFQNGDNMNPVPMLNKNALSDLRPGYGPGVLFVRTENIKLSECGLYDIRQARSRMTFVTSGGTQIELRDTAYGGAPVTYGSCGGSGSPASRGTIFVTADGSAATFISEASISDGAQSVENRSISGDLKLRDGTHYRIDNGLVSWLQDRNGNRITYTYTGDKVTLIQDSIGREIAIEYAVTDSSPYGLCDKITFNGTEGDTRVIRVSYTGLSEALAGGFSIQSKNELFPHPEPDEVNENMDEDFDPAVVSSVWLPDGRRYRFYYNDYAEIARALLPTGGSFEYDWEFGPSYGCNGLFQEGEILRQVKERRVKNDSTLEQREEYSYTGPSCDQSYNTEVTVDHFDGSEMLSREVHSFYGSPAPPNYSTHLFNESRWTTGKEFQTDFYDADGTTLLRKVEQTWQQSADVSWWSCTGCDQTNAPPNNPRVVETVTTLAAYGDDKVSKVTSIDPEDLSGETVGFDEFNNQTDTWEYDYGDGAPGAFLRHRHTDYVTGSNYTDATGAHLRSLPLEVTVSSDSEGDDVVSRTEFEYDNYSSASDHVQHDPLVSRSSVIGHDSTNYGTGFIYRGNVTAVTSFSDADGETGAVTAYSFFDMLGNVVKTRDPREKVTTIEYDDNFGVADDTLSSAGDTTYVAEEVEDYIGESHTFAFPTSTTNPLSWTAYVQYDYFTGKPVNTQDVNGMKSKMIYDDPLDRPTHAVVALTTANQAQTKVVYDDDADRQVIVTSDLDTFDDKLLKKVSLYDGLGRTKETRSYEADSGYRAVQTEFDAMGRAYRVSNPFRSGDTQYWTETTFDALGRPLTTETLHDDAKVITAYDGNRTIVTDQAGKQRISLTNALGQLKDIWEVRASDGSTVSVTFPGGAYSGVAYGYKTSYGYDTLGNLTSVDQGSNDRSFTYDSLSRLLTATNPESGEVQYDYDNNNNLIEKTDAREIVTTFTYDDLNRVTAKAYATPTPSPSPTASPTPAPFQDTPSVAYTYDNLTNSKGRLTKIESSVSTTEYTQFDILGRILKSKQTTDGTAYGNGSTDSYMTYSYNLAGMLIEQQYPSGRKVENELDASGDLARVMSNKDSSTVRQLVYASNFTYNAAGAITSMQLGNTNWESTVFNSRLQPTQIALGTSPNGYDKLKLNYSYGNWVDNSIVASKNNGNIVQQIITVPNSPGESDAFTATQKYYYDSLNRIDDSVETISGETWQQDFEHDRYGNRTFVEANTDFHGFDKLCSGNTVMCSDLKKRMNPDIGSANQVSTSDEYAFDASGNTTEDPDDRRFVYDGENKQVKVLDDGNDTIGEYWYDGDGRRVKKYVPDTGEVTVFVYDATGKQIAEYSTIVANSTDAKVGYLTSDHLGSPRINTDKNGGVTARHDYHPFGEEIVTDARTGHAEYPGDSIRKQFTGYERDKETELDFAQARYYAKHLGRFTSPDEFVGGPEELFEFDGKMGHNPTFYADLADPRSLNKYGYCLNNPVNYIDPDGHQTQISDYIWRAWQAVQSIKGLIYPLTDELQEAKNGTPPPERKNNPLGDFADGNGRNLVKRTWAETAAHTMRVYDTFAMIDPTGASGILRLAVNRAAGQQNSTSDYVITLGSAVLARGKGGNQARSAFAEAKQLLGGWGKGSFHTLAETMRYHFKKHGAEVGATSILQYMRKAEAFARNLTGATRAPVPNGTRYEKGGQYVIKDAQGKIVSYGLVR